MKKGNDLGTEIDHSWWKRYRAPGFCFSRGQDRGDWQWMEQLVADLELERE